MERLYAQCPENFYPRPPRGGRPYLWERNEKGEKISIHALREEGDDEHNGNFEEAKEFLSTPSARRATAEVVEAPEGKEYFYPRPPRGGRLYDGYFCLSRRKISIHALREEGDAIWVLSRLVSRISIHALREEGDSQQKFNRRSMYISIHALREEGDADNAPVADCASISIHALREEGDSGNKGTYSLPTISIHALREEGDRSGWPAGYRLAISIHALREEGDGCVLRYTDHLEISIHALREEGDHRRCRLRQGSLYFYPRPPRGGRPSGSRCRP